MKTVFIGLFLSVCAMVAPGESDAKAAKEKYNEVVRIASRHPAREFAKAAEEGDLKTMTRLLDTGVPVSLQIPTPQEEWEGIPPFEQAIHLAAAGRQVEMVRLLLDRGAQPNARSSDQSTPLHYARNLAVAKILLERGADPVARDNRNSQPIHLAPIPVDQEDATAPGNSAALMQLLIQHGADPLATNNDGEQPIHIAALTGTVESVSFLLDRGAKPDTPVKPEEGNSQDKGRQPLHYAVRRNREAHPRDMEIVKLLLSKGADPNATDDEGQTPLHFTTNPAATPLLLAHGAKVGMMDRGILKQQPLHHFALTGDVTSIKLLLDQGADRDALNGDGETPLDVAAFFGKVEAVKLLLERGAKPTKKTLEAVLRFENNKATPLIRAALAQRPASRR